MQPPKLDTLGISFTVPWTHTQLTTCTGWYSFPIYHLISSSFPSHFLQFLVWILKYPLASLLSKLFSRFLIFPCPGWKIRWRAEKTQVWETLSLRARTVFHGLFLLSPQHSSQDSPSFYLTNPGKSWLGTSGPRMTAVWLRASFFFFPWASVPTQAKQCK